VRHLLLEGVRYNDEKEQEVQWTTKIKELERIEIAKKKAEEKSEFTFIFFAHLVSLCYITLYYVRIVQCTVFNVGLSYVVQLASYNGFLVNYSYY